MSEEIVVRQRSQLHLTIVVIVMLSCSSQGSEEFRDGIDVKKATLLNLLRVMGQARALNVNVPIVFNRDSELFQSYLEQRRTPRRARIDVPETLYREDLKDIHPLLVKGNGSALGSIETVASKSKPINHLKGVFVREFENGGSKLKLAGADAVGLFKYFQPVEPSSYKEQVQALTRPTNTAAYPTRHTTTTFRTTVKTTPTIPVKYGEIVHPYQTSYEPGTLSAHRQFHRSKQPRKEAVTGHYHQPVVEPVHATSIVRPTSPSDASPHRLGDRNVPSKTSHRHSQVEHTTPHPLVYGFLPVTTRAYTNSRRAPNQSTSRHIETTYRHKQVPTLKPFRFPTGFFRAAF